MTRLVGPFAWLRTRHSAPAEIALLLALYAAYETSRGIVVGNAADAVHHARTIAAVERSVHLFVEGSVQRAAEHVPGLVGTLDFLYLTMHLTATLACLAWLHRRRREQFPLVRTALFLASGLALVGYLAFPAAPPRLAAVGLADTISGSGVDLDHGLISSLYNPFAAFPSVHIAYAVIVGASLVRYGSRRAMRIVGALYPPLVLLVIVATGNHFVLDAAAGAAVAVAGLAGAAALDRGRRAQRREGIGVPSRPSGCRTQTVVQS
jgi:PAP2 superfamily protein